MPAREKAARGKNYHALEDLELAKAYVHVSTDASVGINQTAETMWTRIKEVMESSKHVGDAISQGTLEPRAWTSLQAHFSQIQKSVAKYVGCVKVVESIRESGSTERDMMKKALTMYKTRHGHSFSYIDCYDELSKCPKFQYTIEKLAERKKIPRSGKRKSYEDGSAEVSEETTRTEIQSSSRTTIEVRPLRGVKAAKAAKVEESMLARTVKAQEALSKSMDSKVRVLKEQLVVNQALHRLQEEEILHRMLNEIFSIQPSGPEHAAFLEKRRASLLCRLNALEARDVPEQPPSSGSFGQPLGTEASRSCHENLMREANGSIDTNFKSTPAPINVDTQLSPECLSAVSPVVLGPVTPLSLSDTPSSYLSSSFCQLAQSSQVTPAESQVQRKP